jgi:N-acyl-D-amino-acid deacylase
VSAVRVAVALLAALAAAQAEPAFDVIIRGGLVFDGTGAPGYKADVAVAKGRVARVGDLGRQRAEVEIDAAGLYVAPGFINIHSHPIGDGLMSATNMLTQGVTTEILNPDGGGPIDLAHQMEVLAGGGLAVNIGAYIGFNSAWSQVVGPADRRPTPDEMARMREIIAKGLEQGAWGVSAGLDYKPAYFATTREVGGIVSVASAWRTNFTNHDRITPESNFSSRVGVQETIDIGKEAGLVPVVTHMKAQGVEQGTALALSKLMAASTSAGTYTAADVYPYVAGQSGLGALIIPGWAQEGGRDAMLKRFADPRQRARIAAEAEQAMTARFGGPNGVFVTTNRRELTDVMREMQVPAGEAVLRLLEMRDMGAILRFGIEDDVIALLRHPSTSVACDCGATASGASHPRYFGSFPRVLGRYVREMKRLTWEDAIRKMTGLPASTIGIVDRGFLAAGMAADITVLDPATVTDHATFEQPAQPSEGIQHVLVNGTIALRDGRPTGDKAGRVLVRKRYMPSRPLPINQRRRVRVKGAGFTIDLRQNARARSASGTLRWKDAASNSEMEATVLGILQVAPGWSSITGWARTRPSGELRPVTITIDRSNSPAEGGPSLVIDVDGDVLRRIPIGR